MKAATSFNPSQKTCSICGRSFAKEHFNYGSKENRSYCQECNRQDQEIYAKSGREAARAFRDEMRRKWQR